MSQHEEEELQRIGGPLLAQDFDASLSELQKTHCDSIGAPQVRVVSFLVRAGVDAGACVVCRFRTSSGMTWEAWLTSSRRFSTRFNFRSTSRNCSLPVCDDLVCCSFAHRLARSNFHVSPPLRRRAAVRTARHRQDAPREGSGDRVFAQLPQREGTRAAQHVRGSERGERAQG